jgi:hypothetical protein
MKRQPLTLTLSLCSICRFKHCDTLNYRKSLPTCDAFPNGVPEAVRKNPLDHRREIPGDNGIRFELAAETDSLRQLFSAFGDLFKDRSLKSNREK